MFPLVGRRSPGSAGRESDRNLKLAINQAGEDEIKHGMHSGGLAALAADIQRTHKVVVRYMILTKGGCVFARVLSVGKQLTAH